VSAIAPTPVPVIAIDGPTASGKGTVAQRVAAALGYHYLDSGALYRLVALQSLRRGVAVDDAPALAAIAAALRPSFATGVTVDGARRGWWPTAATWARWCSRTRAPRCS
jgi:cytidylate kinase